MTVQPAHAPYSPLGTRLRPVWHPEALTDALTDVHWSGTHLELAVVGGDWRQGDFSPAAEPGRLALRNEEVRRMMECLLGHRNTAPSPGPAAISALAAYPVEHDTPTPRAPRVPGTYLLGATEQSPAGNSVLRIGRVTDDGRSWQQSHYVVLAPAEREELLLRVVDGKSAPRS